MKSYIEFINEDWKDDLTKEFSELSDSIITKDEIEDYFLELVDDGFSFTCYFRMGYINSDNCLNALSKKVEILQQNCFPFYVITLRKEFSKDNSISQMKKKMEVYTKYMNTIEINSNRLSNLQKDIKLIKIESSISNDILIFSIILKIEKNITSNNLEIGSVKKRANRSTYTKIFDIISSNKIFDIGTCVDGKSIEFSLKDEYIYLSADKIITAIINKSYDIKNVKLHKIGDDKYKITVFE